MFKKISIKANMILGFSIPFVLTILIVVSLLTSLRLSSRNFQLFIDYPNKALSAVQETQIEIGKISRYLRDMVIVTDNDKNQEYIDTINNSKLKIGELLKTLEDTYQGTDDLVRDFRTAINNWYSIADKIIEADTSGEQLELERLILVDCPENLKIVTEVAAKINQFSDEQSNQFAQANLARLNNASIINFILMLIVFILGIIVNIKTISAIMIPIRKLRKLAAEVYNGDFNAQLDYRSDNEFGALAEDMGKTIVRWISYFKETSKMLNEIAAGNLRLEVENEYVGDFKEIEIAMNHINRSLNATMYKINQSSETLANNSMAVSSEAQALASGATEQASTIEEISGAVHEISEKVNSNLINCKNTIEASKNAEKAVSHGNEQMVQLVKAMNEINVSSNEIGRIIKVIDDIAFQTNILALNAAVEAARAGVAGKGFAVVADEVRNLAAKSAQASKNTTEMIQNSLNAVENGSKIAEQTASVFTSIIEGSKESTRLVNLISDATEQQTKALENVTYGMEQISAVIQSNSASAEESAAASEELSGQAQILKALVNEFRLKDQ